MTLRIINQFINWGELRSSSLKGNGRHHRAGGFSTFIQVLKTHAIKTVNEKKDKLKEVLRDDNGV